MSLQEIYVCQRCGNCCRWPGAVRLKEAEVGALAAFLGLEEREFIRDYTELHPDRRGLMLKNRQDGSCVFLEGRNVCRVQAVKPWQCRQFPNGWNFPGWRDVCEAIAMPVATDHSTQ